MTIRERIREAVNVKRDHLSGAPTPVRPTRFRDPERAARVRKAREALDARDDLR